MPSPSLFLTNYDLSRQAEVVRDIDNQYQMELIAESNHQLVEYQAQLLRLQHEAAITNIRNMTDSTYRQDQANNLLSALVGGVDQISHSIDSLNATEREALHALNAQTEVMQRGFEDLATRIQGGFEDIASRMMEQQHELENIGYLLSKPYETKVRELLNEAENALMAAMQSRDRDQLEEFKDASRLLQDVLANPIGSRNYVAWFNTGWINWKFNQNLAEAEEAFYQAARLSAPYEDIYHTKSLRYLAYMQYFQGRPDEAYKNILKALRVRPNDHDIMYDSARYAAITGLESKTLELLDKCIDLQPQTIEVMFSEKDFLSSATLQQGLASLGVRKMEEARTTAQHAIMAWQKAINDVHHVENISEYKLDLNNEQFKDAQQATKDFFEKNGEYAELYDSIGLYYTHLRDQARTKVQHAIMAWLNAIKNIYKAENIAEHKIDLANEQFKGAQQAAAMVSTASYVLALYLINKATAECNETIANAKEVLKKEIWICNQAEVEANFGVKAAKNEVQAAMKDIQMLNMQTRNSLTNFLTMFFIFILSVTAPWFYNVKDLGNYVLISLGIFSLIYFCALWLIRKHMDKRVPLKKHINELENLINVLGKHIVKVQTHQKKIENALEWLTAQA